MNKRPIIDLPDELGEMWSYRVEKGGDNHYYLITYVAGKQVRKTRQNKKELEKWFERKMPKETDRWSVLAGQLKIDDIYADNALDLYRVVMSRYNRLELIITNDESGCNEKTTTMDDLRKYIGAKVK